MIDWPTTQHHAVQLSCIINNNNLIHNPRVVCVSVCVRVRMLRTTHPSGVKVTKGKGTKICIAPYPEKLTPEALRYGSHSFYPANTPYLHLPRSI